MGVLVAKAYPTKLFLKLADHTYVQCDTGGKKWSCWGGTTGGRVIARGPASTKRANAIAQPDEKANIKCYLINGVCHQAANRILLPAGVLVSRARGYSISSALFGTYGRVGFWPCFSPFQQYPTVTGDLPACVRKATARRVPMARGVDDKLDWQFIQGALEIHREVTRLQRRGTAADDDVMAVNLAQFVHMAAFHLGPMMDGALARKLRGVRRRIESRRARMERALGEGEMRTEEFVERFNALTLAFQTDMANALDRDQYQTLFDLKPDEQVVLADPRIVARAFRGWND